MKLITYEEAQKAYGKLKPIEKAILQCMAIYYLDTDSTDVFDRFSGLEFLHQAGKKITLQEVGDIMSRLARSKIVDGYYHDYHIMPQYDLIASRDAVQSGAYDKIAEAARKPVFNSIHYRSYSDAQGKISLAIREIRFAFFERRFSELEELLARYYAPSGDNDLVHDPLMELMDKDFVTKDVLELPKNLQAITLGHLLRRLAIDGQRPAPLPYAESLLPETKDCPNREPLQLAIAEQYIYQGKLDRAASLLEGLTSPRALRTKAWIVFLRGDTEKAIELYEDCMAEEIARLKGKKPRFILWHDLAGAHYILALLTTGRNEHQAKAAAMLKGASKAKGFHPVYNLYEACELLSSSLLGEKLADASTLLIDDDDFGLRFGVLGFYTYLPLFWHKSKKLRQEQAEMNVAAINYSKNQYRWLDLEMEIINCTISNPPEIEKSHAAKAELKAMGIESVALRFKNVEPWERALNALQALRAAPAEESAGPKQTRLIWGLLDYQGNISQITPYEQKANAAGAWSKGRPVALKQLANASKKDFPFLTEQDWEVCKKITVVHESSWRRYDNSYHYLHISDAMPALIGHPNVYRGEDRDIRVELQRGEPSLQLEPEGDYIKISLLPRFSQGDKIVSHYETPTRIRVIPVTPQMSQLAGILGKGLKAPASARQRVLDTIAGITHIASVHSDVGDFASDLPVEQVEPDLRPYVHLMPAGVGLRIEILARPLGEKGPYYAPAAGGETVLAEVGGKRLKVRRDLGAEHAAAERLVEACPSLADGTGGNYRWALDDAEECLDTLMALQNLGDELVMEWPEGGRMRVQGQAAMSNFSMKIQSQKDWFSVSGDVKVDDELVYNLRQMIELSKAHPGRFIPLGEGRFLALTKEFRRRLDEISALGESRGDSIRFSPLAALAMVETTNDVAQLKTDKAWKEMIARTNEAMDRIAEVPHTLQAELRDYQVEGYRWLDRLAHWGAGACLADDMGLGKTLQALALVLSRVGEGAALVVAPTSVCMNWMAEASRFAPTLNMVSYGTGDRKQMLADLEPRDVLVVTYTLLQQDADLFAEQKWGTIVLDEAQAIKNAATRRSKAAMRLEAGFRMVTTGTPIENNLGELWNLFRFLNPSLLGSLERFNERFAAPIERNGDKEVRHRLKRLIQPFILRRTKSQVLQELPPRTEITRTVSLTTEEKAFYEALRQKALETIDSSDGEAAGQKRFRVLAEIMRLRRACCNAQLVAPGIEIPSSRLAEFKELIEELIEGRHKALVFSQFVDHLSIIRGFLDEKKISYQYLDGATPAAERKKRVDAFQQGEGDVFLISLRAGGLGLNLTAADYVIHMDPWWNPAVENQASDRAHRIGQERPVTIYRLIAENTIEQKIVELHERKRDLADSLLEDTDMGAKITTEELVQLLRENILG